MKPQHERNAFAPVKLHILRIQLIECFVWLFIPCEKSVFFCWAKFNLQWLDHNYYHTRGDGNINATKFFAHLPNVSVWGYNSAFILECKVILHKYSGLDSEYECKSPKKKKKFEIWAGWRVDQWETSELNISFSCHMFMKSIFISPQIWTIECEQYKPPRNISNLYIRPTIYTIDHCPGVTEKFNLETLFCSAIKQCMSFFFVSDWECLPQTVTWKSQSASQNLTLSCCHLGADWSSGVNLIKCRPNQEGFTLIATCSPQSHLMDHSSTERYLPHLR